MTEQVRTYYGQPVLKPPAWTWEVPWYLFVGGLAGASSVVAGSARLVGDDDLADRARLVAAAGAVASPVLLIKDLGRPSRFLNMLRVFRPTSAMSVGSWILAAYGTTATAAAGTQVLGVLPRVRRLLDVVGSLLGPAMATYTAALVSDTSVPVWHEARGELPVLFAGSAAASSGAALLLVGADPQVARRLVLGGVAVELVAGQVMQERLGEIREVYEEGEAGRFEKAAKVCNVAGAAAVAVAGALPRRVSAPARHAGAALVLAGSVCQRWAVFKAGFASAADPAHVVGPQRRRRGGAGTGV